MEILAERKTKTVYKDENRTIKLFVDEYPKSNILNEALNQARVEETGLNIPKLLEVSKIGSRWALISEYIQGKSLETLMQENPEKIDEYMELFINTQLEVLSKQAPLLNKLKNKMKRKIEETDLSDAIKFELNMRLESTPKHNRVCHGDFNPSNVIVTDDGKVYVIDWAHVTQGNSSADVARTYLLFCLRGDQKLADKYLDLFCKKTDTAKQYVQKWLPIVAASQSVKGNPEERDFLLRWADVVDYE